MTLPELIRQRLWFQYGIKISKDCDAAIDEEIKDTFAQSQAELAQLREKLAKTIAALRMLRNEVKGTLYAHELAIRIDSGNSNWTCLEIALALAEKELGEAATTAKGEK